MNREWEKLERIGVEPPRSYYIPFGVEEKFCFRNRIIDRTGSKRFISLDGLWKIKAHKSIDDVCVGEKMTENIPVPSCVQMYGYDQVQYLNIRYPFPFQPPLTPKENPTFHYRKNFHIDDLSWKYYLNFEGVDSCFYVYVNGKEVGFSQISHATSEFDITSCLKTGENVLDVVVLKWCASSYLECQDKFRFTGIFRSVYLLQRPQVHIRDFKIETEIDGQDGIICIKNESKIPFFVNFQRKKQELQPNQSIRFVVKNAKLWSAETPHLYSLILSANGEKILQRVGIRTSKIENGIYKINGKHIKLKGVNRHESNPKTGATVTVADTVCDLRLMKWANVNAIRTSHYPDCPEFYDLCDAYGFYVMDEADLETHGACAYQGGYDRKLWQDFANNGIFDDGVYEREVLLLERDKNRTCVVIWSLGNESSYGKMFYRGADYIHKRDARPIHYENIWEMADKTEYYTDRLDIVSRMYPEVSFFEEYLTDIKETRPLVLCEYSHAMGNSNGDLSDYWEKIDQNERFIGAFVWEWCDHAVKTEKGFLYGGDFGEIEHDGNFCVDGLVTPDRKIKSNLRELKAVYGGKRREKEKLRTTAFVKKTVNNPISYEIDDCGRLRKIGDILLTNPFSVCIERAYLDNDKYINEWRNYENCQPHVCKIEQIGNRVKIVGKMVKNCLQPLLDFDLEYTFFDTGVDISFSYEVADFVSYLPRIGLVFSLPKNCDAFEYDGYGPYESYIDKRLASEYGSYRSTAKKEYYPWIKPQETGSHYGSERLKINNAFTVTAEIPFSFSVLPYSVKQLREAKHHFELPKSNGVYVHLDVAMSGVGTASCGPALIKEYQAPKKGNNTFRIILNK